MTKGYGQDNMNGVEQFKKESQNKKNLNSAEQFKPQPKDDGNGKKG